MNGKFKPVPCGETRLAVLSVVLRRWFDKSMRVRSPTFREVMNDLRKFYGMKVTQRQIANIVREFEEKEIVERSRSTERGLGRATVVTLKPNRICNACSTVLSLTGKVKVPSSGRIQLSTITMVRGHFVRSTLSQRTLPRD
jgi:hypothetical protein